MLLFGTTSCYLRGTYAVNAGKGLAVRPDRSTHRIWAEFDHGFAGTLLRGGAKVYGNAMLQVPRFCSNFKALKHRSCSYHPVGSV